ncbi:MULTISPECIES: FMN-binding protein [unclassified Lentimicrobium]|uniref:FMN-binding protein n=1 Tax=unclassified Lentimicrobium TaxID=2677434 RepID=UPI001551AD4E|nr:MULTISPECIES: 4Fe-4S binding protein [unclassified Lentimicrobium]NPD47676.1 FMN-binding protein [Lentimicrobium sp. S6]NPD86974.1 FMN-binding protein [Lentimicrobium sp. L6]
MYNHQKVKKKREAWLTLIAMLFIIAAWIAGGLVENADILSTIKEKMPDIAKFEELESSTYKIYNAEDMVLGYLSVESAMGYGGPLQMAVAVDQDGKIFDLAVVSSKETPSYLEKVLDTDFLDDIIGKSFTDTYTIGVDIDGISSATYSSNAILEASKMGDRFVSAKVLGFDVPEKESPSLQFGGAEMVLILLFAIGYFAHKKTFKYKKIARWGTMLVGLFVLGFFYNKPFTLSMINQLLLGYFPPLHSHLYWYMLLFGVFFVFTVDNKNPYCQWFCPFGAAQECMGLVGGAKHRSVGKFKNIFKWSLRIITLFAIIMALLLRNPGVTSYEIFGTLFKLTGSNFQFAILGIILVASMFIKRPWCTYLCPLGPVTDHFSHLRGLVMGKWKGSMQKHKNV